MTVRSPHLRRFIVSMALSLGAIPAAGQAPTPPPFTSAVQRVPIDVTVVDANGRPVTDLTPSDFQVTVDGSARRVASAEWVSMERRITEAGTSPLPAGFSSNQQRTTGRLILVIVDQPNIPFGATLGLRTTLERFLDALAPGDLVAAVGLGSTGRSTGFTADRTVTKAALARMTGQRQPARPSTRGVDMATALAAQRGDYARRDAFIIRECGSLTKQFDRDMCASEVTSEMAAMALPVMHDGDATIRGLQAALAGLARIEAPKSVILVSEGFLVEGNQANISGRIVELGPLADAAQASLYVLHLDGQSLEVERSRTNPVDSAPSDERRMRRQSMSTLASATGATMLSVSGDGGGVFERLASELSGYYLLGLEANDDDQDIARPLRVTTSRPGLTIRARRLFGGGADSTPARSPRELVASALANPFTLSGLALRAASFSLQGSDAGKLQLLIKADIGERYSAPQSVVLAYVISDAQGQVVGSQSFGGRLTPAIEGMASPLAYVAGASVPPGDYTLKLAVAIGDAVGSLEHPIHAALTADGTLTVSDLTVGGPVPTDTPTAPTVDPVVRFGAVHGYVEAYGGSAPSAKAHFKITSGDQAAPLIRRDVSPGRVGASRTIFNDLVSVNQLPPGRYRLRAVVSSDGGSATLSREFDVEVSARSAAASVANGSVPASKPLFLPVTPADMNPAFNVAELLREDVVSSFSRTMPFETFTSFERGIDALRKHDLPRAELNFKDAVQPDVDTTAALTYLGAVFAEAKQDREAAAIWQTALVDGSDHALLYALSGEALLRLHDLPAALAILEDGQRRWPADVRFARPLALLYASLGRGRDAVTLLQRHLAEGSPSPESLALGVEWIYRAHVEGVVIAGRDEDLALARRYADQYARANGPRQPLLQQWLDYLSRP